jgi:hypothetical protein
MSEEKLKRANELAREIYKIKNYLESIKWMINESVVERPVSITFSGCSSHEIIAPDSLFKVIGRLLYNEYQQKLMDLEKEFWNL